ncbi:unnamed protein product [Kuraishia capsulata CBS 1993]|uniref:Uncharacterized protein n=1 Tax=Kuraishia capsulata CBS 1993 TaxID=1382522 RepID=W6MY22_9ASCO|nr:uncharacterized protein KUCA_T00005874001 [Kuraishia capsulata CBS 1993]CDK29880.1 unnamed protein product [Kuraishia capsulata CBS 1993]
MWVFLVNHLQCVINVAVQNKSSDVLPVEGVVSNANVLVHISHDRVIGMALENVPFQLQVLCKRLSTIVVSLVIEIRFDKPVQHRRYFIVRYRVFPCQWSREHLLRVRIIGNHRSKSARDNAVIWEHSHRNREQVDIVKYLIFEGLNVAVNVKNKIFSSRKPKVSFHRVEIAHSYDRYQMSVLDSRKCLPQVDSVFGVKYRMRHEVDTTANDVPVAELGAKLAVDTVLIADNLSILPVIAKRSCFVSRKVGNHLVTRVHHEPN